MGGIQRQQGPTPARLIDPHPFKCPATVCRMTLLAAVAVAALAASVRADVDLPVATEVRPHVATSQAEQ